ncbi:MAG: spheroidene monooxygenase [Acidimicrobiia bacterium]
MIASVHMADVGRRRALSALRKAPEPSSAPGLRRADIALTAPLSGRLLPAPDLGRLALVALWDDDAALDRFLDRHPTAEILAGGWRVRLEPLRASGTWPGLDHDVPSDRVVDSDGPVAVLTLGRLRAARAVPFFRTSAKAEAAAIVAPGLIWASGLARPPFVATCSLWENARVSSTYAYGNREPAHSTAITADRARPFHHQSAFVRFRPYGSEGCLDGRNPLPSTWLSNV